MGSDRISYEHEVEAAAAERLAGKLIEQAMPGVFSGGKQIVRTAVEEGAMLFEFSDGSAMRVVGSFRVQYAERSWDMHNVVDGTCTVTELERRLKGLPAGSSPHPNGADLPCTLCGTTSDVGLTEGCSECEGITEPRGSSPAAKAETLEQS